MDIKFLTLNILLIFVVACDTTDPIEDTPTTELTPPTQQQIAQITPPISTKAISNPAVEEVITKKAPIAKSKVETTIIEAPIVTKPLAEKPAYKKVHVVPRPRPQPHSPPPPKYDPKQHAPPANIVIPKPKIKTSTQPKSTTMPKATATSIAEKTTYKKVHVVPRPHPHAATPKKHDPTQHAPPANIIIPKSEVKTHAQPHPLETPKSEPDVTTSVAIAGTLEGQVQIIIKGKKKRASDVIIALEPLDTHLIKPRPSKTLTIKMRDKTYTPSHLAVQVGDKIQFTNLDHFKHNVFSSSKPNVFDLGTYGPDKKPTVNLQQPGLVKIYCNIHPNMATFVMVSSVDRAAIVNKAGTYKITNLPAGFYRVKAWNIRADWQQTIEIKPAENKQLDIVLNASQYKPKPHLNKYGKPYPKKKVSFEDDDEFY